MTDEASFVKKAEVKGLAKEYEEIRRITKSLESRCTSFAYNAFQAYAALKVIIANNLTSVGEMPTGSRKSYVATIVAK